MTIRSTPDNQGWQCGGWNFYVADDGIVTKGRPGETPTPLVATQNLLDFSAVFTLPTNPVDSRYLKSSGDGVISLATAVSSIDLAVPTGFTTSGGPIVDSDTLTLGFAAGYSLPLSASQSNWDTAFGWGDHAVAGYLLSSTAATTYQPLDSDLTAIGALTGTTGLLRKTAANTWSLDTATYLQSSEIGSTVLAYDVNLQAFVDTFTLPTTDGASGQVLTTNGAGVISFATPVTSLSDPTYIGGVAYFNRSTKPVERSSGVPLVARDRWYNTSDGTEWFWNGDYWLETVLRSTEPSFSGTNAGEGLRYKSVTGGSPVLDYLSANVVIEEIGIYSLPGQTANLRAGDADNRVNYRLGYFNSGSSFTDAYIIKSNEIVQSPTAFRVDSYKVTLNQVLLDFRAFSTVFSVIGTGGGAPTTSVRLYANYRNIYL